MGNQDKGYKLLFSNREIVRDLLTEFVDPEIVKEDDVKHLAPWKLSLRPFPPRWPATRLL
jgi:hypothetical protein